MRPFRPGIEGSGVPAGRGRVEQGVELAERLVEGAGGARLHRLVEGLARAGERVGFGAWGLIGGGGGCLQNQMTGDCRERVAFFALEPELFMHVVVHRNVAISLSAGYRFVAAGAWSGPGSWGLASPAGGRTPGRGGGPRVSATSARKSSLARAWPAAGRDFSP